MKTLVSTALVAALIAIGCGGSEKKTENPTPIDDDTKTATPVGDDGNGTVMTDAPMTAADPAMIAKGASIFEEYCSTCHGDDGSGSGKNPAIKGAGTLSAFPTDAALFEYTKKEMPKDDPGSLSDDDYKAVIAWMKG